MDDEHYLFYNIDISSIIISGDIFKMSNFKFIDTLFT